MTSTFLTVVVALLAMIAFAGRLIYLYDQMRERAAELVKLATGGNVHNPLTVFGLIRDQHRRFVDDQRNYGRQAEASRRARCPSAPLSMRERWVLVALNGGDEPKFVSLGSVAAATGLSHDLVSLIARTLKATGYVDLTPVYSGEDEDTFAGRGYSLTPQGEEAKAAILGRRTAGDIGKVRGHVAASYAARETSSKSHSQVLANG